MKPLINLKSFLAVLLILIVPAALLVAYFRNFSTEGGGHEHGGKANGGAEMKMDGGRSGMKSGGEDHAAMGHGDKAMSGDESAMKPSGDSNAAMGHGDMPMPQDEQKPQQQQAQATQPPAAQPGKEADHAAMGHGPTAPPSPSQPQQAQTTPPPGAAAGKIAPTSAGMMKSMSSMGASFELGGMQAMGSVKNLTDGGKGTEAAARLFHAGAKDFFLDHAQRLALNAEQQKKLNQIKEQALLDKASANRKIQEAEQQLWKSTASDEPNPAEIETKVREIEKLRADQRLATIHSVGEATKALTDEQTKILLGTVASAMSNAKPATPGSMPTPKSDRQNKP